MLGEIKKKQNTATPYTLPQVMYLEFNKHEDI